MQIVAIAAGGAVGALLRYGVSLLTHQVLGRGFPYGTLMVNVLGSLLMGFLYVFLVDRMSLAPEWRAALLIGLLGAFTTFSTFSFETVSLLEQGESIKAFLNIILNVTLCLAATWIGIIVGRQL